ncbi:MAG TPA: AMP-binding protein, partial [Myxococcales bacterium]|nr:AMP-binding protein [Myxococcales bacterium]
MIGVVPALDSHEGVHDRGFTFVGAGGPGEDKFVSFHDLRAAAQRRAAHYLASGLRRGDRLAIIVPEGEHFIPAFLGALWAGLIPVPLYPPVSLGKLDAFMDALVSILNVARPRVLVTTDRVGKVLWSAVGRIPSIEKVLSAEELSREPASALPPAAEVKDGDVAFLQFTSGSTALPKGVMVTHGSLAANCSAIVREGLQADLEKGNDVAVSWLPLYHDMGLIGFVIAPLCSRIPTVFIPTLSFIKNATLWMETLSRHKGTMTFAPNFAYALVTKRAKPEQIARWDLSPMRVFGCGAEPINAATLRAFVEAMKPAGLRPEAMLPCYGMAEATLAMSFMPLHEPVRTDRIDPDRYHADRKAV